MENLNLSGTLVLIVAVVIVALILFALNLFLLVRRQELTAEQRLPRQFAMLAATIVGLIAIVLALPITESSRNQLLGLLGVLLSGVIAFSSTTIVSNLMAGLVLRLNKAFRAGDYIRCQGFAGRVSEKGLLDTEIQTEQRNLIHIANSYLITHPVEVIRSSGTLIHAEVSLGYDLHHAIIEKHLIQAAEKAGLSDAFVHITNLGDFSVNYKVSGLLVDTKSMFTTKSHLFAGILDELHNHDIEIMSPNMIAPRTVDPSHQFIAKPSVLKVKESTKQEDLAFDKADEAEKIDLERTLIKQKITEFKIAQDPKSDTGSILSDEQREQMADKIKTLEQQLLSLTESEKTLSDDAK